MDIQALAVIGIARDLVVGTGCHIVGERPGKDGPGTQIQAGQEAEVADEG